MTTDSKAVCGGGETMQQLRAAVEALGITDMWLDNNHPWRLMVSRGSWNLALAEQHPDHAPGDGKWADGKAVCDIVNAAIQLCQEPAALASTAGAGAWRPMNTAPSDTPIVARHKPNSRTPHGWIATISRAPEDPDERVGGLDTILHYNGDALKRGFHGVWVGWMYPEEFAALALSAGTLSVGWDGARDAFARIVEDRAWTAEHGEPRAACLRAASDIRQAKAPAVPASPRTGAGEGAAPELLAALKMVRTLHAEGCLTGFNDAGWQTSLIRSGQRISDAIRLAEADGPITPAPAVPASPRTGAGEGELVPYLHRQWTWSRETFGPALRTKGIIQHITKELGEIEREPHDLSEWVDVIILAMDGFWRHGGTPEDLMPRLQAKQDKNFARTWPDWRTMGEDQAIEHDRSGEPLSQGGGAGRSEKGEGEEAAFREGWRANLPPDTADDPATVAFIADLEQEAWDASQAKASLAAPAQSPSTSDAEG